MKMVKYHVENFARIKLFDVEFDPSTNLIVISGANAAGKSSATMALWKLFEGANAGKKITMPVRKGADQAVISVKLDNGLLVEKVIRAADGKEVLKITNAEGFTSAKQGTLNAVLGTALNIEEFRSLDKHKQLETLLDVVGLKTKHTEIQSQYDVMYQQRTEIGRRRDMFKAQITTIPNKVALVDVTALMQKLTGLNKSKMENENHLNQITVSRNNITNAEKQIQQLMQDIVKTHADITVREAAIVPVDEAEFNQVTVTLSQATETNKQAQLWEKYTENKQKFDEVEQQYNSKTEQLDKLLESKNQLLVSAKFPLEGITFTDEVLYNGIPIKQLEGGSQELFVNFAIAVASIPPDGLRVVRVPNGERLDGKSRLTLLQMATVANVQVLFEVVDTSGTQGIYIEDGEIAQNNLVARSE